MNNEIKVNKSNKSITFINNGIAFSQFGVADEILDLITNLQEKVNQYENPDDMTLMFMWCDEKAKDKIKQLQVENEELKGIAKLRKDTLIMNQKKVDKLQERNEKAIKLLKEAGCYEEDTKIFCSDIYQELPELLNILQGEDNANRNI